MAYDVARVRGLHPSLGDGWVHFDAQNGMLVPDSVATTVSTAFRGSMPTAVGPHPSARRSAAVLTAARQAVADLVNADPRGVVLGADRAQLLTALAEASSSRVGLGYEVVVTRLDDEANIAPWLRAANRYGAKVKWAEVDIETGELPAWQWEGLIDKPTRLVAIASASSTLGTVTDLGEVTKLTHEVGGMVVVDHSAAAPYRLIDINEIDADVVALNAVPWGGPPIGALVFRDPSTIDSLASVSLNPHATGPARLEVGMHQYGLLGGVVASIEYLSNLDDTATGSRRERLTISMRSAGAYLDRLFEYLVASLRSLPLVMVIGRPESQIPVLSFVVRDIPAERVVQRLADNGILAISNASSRVLDVIGVNDIGGAVTVGLSHYSTGAEVDQLVRALASLG
ncbi:MULTISPECIES: cysteine desulfurase-like protein [Mycolicibacterium]|jgi:cysteine desulfurase family protein (TIGR01976 family)|uniref:Aminotransferase/cysteine desulfurase n=3 Tax=Mycolicibacterium fortuitum TaxID=1766 RepID=A0A1A3SHC7_MYCFO|nr:MULTISPECIES: cysteine desulfurase-like protein [Mycolicibacterium]AIY48794.1 Cysteine desulfurase [Mycobacterium sp. VKM Ac-1817D]CRL78690.1 cysteine desulfurase [Mycolicibacter nonchromogenicus]AMD56112.1 aminotransferase [Mycolicibacterium fortuitum subsp. fortuitum DSM 46621 = ATCC 6841 = JCM 6387]EJZ09295.1 cysteine desulfurase [Mycolicibacterium fortuitum subsp. fortuitum DSM 46621 = ATCC 6841 = JCM 6387]MBP3084473.1 cysteine desulfurase-like protein [Mycolicibacterium fortuitum]